MNEGNLACDPRVAARSSDAADADNPLRPLATPIMLIDMHDYNPQAKAYWWVTASLGALVLGMAVWSTLHASSLIIFEIVFGATFAALAGIFAARIPGAKISSGAAELVIFLLLLELGSPAAAIAAAAEAGAISWRTSKRWTSRLGSPAIAGLAMYGAGNAFELAKGNLPPEIGPGVWTAYVLLLVFAILYFAMNTLLMATLIRLKRREPLQLFATLREHRWLVLVYMASASIALLIQSVFSKFSVSNLLLAGPVIAVFVSMLHMYFKRAEERQRFQAERLANAERAAVEASRHVQELQASEERFQSAFTHAAVGMMLVTTQGRVLQVNPSLARLLGRSEVSLADTALDDLIHADDIPMLKGELRCLLADEENTFVSELRCRHTAAVEVWASVSGSLFTVKPPLSRCIILQFQDITTRRRAETRLQHMANHDSLTDLPNRNCFMEELDKMLMAAAKHPDRRFAVLFLDFDRFKLVNDSLGHGAGDTLLRGIARRLQKHLRPTDLVARFGGDEFAVLLRDTTADQEAVQLADRILEVIAEPFHVNGVAITTTASIGITTSAFGYDSADQVLRDADTAMYRAKGQGRARFAVFDSALHSEVANRLWLESELRNAVAHQELALAFQPIYDCATRSLVGFEALARWKHAQRGPIPPDAFIRIAEETGLIIPLGRWALRAACHTLASWCAADPRAASIAMHVNVSGVQLAQPDFPMVVRQALDDSAVDAAQLVIEVTESILIERSSVAIPHLQELRDLGVGISIDDFGTGYSSFSMLHQLPVDEIKIDRSFIDQLGESERGDAVVATMLSLGRTLGKEMVAEGIETEAQLARLIGMGCSRGQGYLLGRPLPAEEADVLVTEALASAARSPEPAKIHELRRRRIAGGAPSGNGGDGSADAKVRRLSAV